MSDIWIPYGGGADLDPVTATAADVRRGKTIVDKDGNPISGTMPDIAGGTITPTTSQQTLNGGGYLTGDVVVPGFTPPPANVIKKGYVLNVFGIKITGSFEGWVPSPQDLYYNGQNPSGFKIADGNKWQFQNTKIQCLFLSERGSNALYFGRAYDVRSYSKLILEGRFVSYSSYYTMTVRLSSPNMVPGFTTQTGIVSASSVTLNIEPMTTIPVDALIAIDSSTTDTYINRIRLA